MSTKKHIFAIAKGVQAEGLCGNIGRFVANADEGDVESLYICTLHGSHPHAPHIAESTSDVVAVWSRETNSLMYEYSPETTDHSLGNSL